MRHGLADHGDVCAVRLPGIRAGRRLEQQMYRLMGREFITEGAREHVHPFSRREVTEGPEGEAIPARALDVREAGGRDAVMQEPQRNAHTTVAKAVEVLAAGNVVQDRG